MGETSARIPKPMIPIGDRPILWHIMKYYVQLRASRTSSSASATRPRSIKEYFLNYNEALSNDFVLSDGGKRGRAARSATSTTGRSPSSTPACTSPIGQRLKTVAAATSTDDEVFLANYGDRLTDAPLPRHGRHARRRATRSALFLASRPTYNFHVVSLRRRQPGAGDRSDVTTSDALDQRRLLRLPPGDLRLHRRGRGSRRGAVPAADRRGASSRRTRTTASGRRWTRSRTSTSSRACSSPGRPRGGRRAACPRRRRPRTSRSHARSGGRRRRARSSSVLAIGCHADDIEIGCGGTLLRARRAASRGRGDAGSCSARDGDAGRRGAGERGRVPGGVAREPRRRSRRSATASSRTSAATVKECFERLKPTVSPDLVFTHPRTDLHQDHRLVVRADLEHLPRPPDPRVRDPEVRRRPRLARTSSSRSTRTIVNRKIELLLEHFATQRAQALVHRRPLPRPDAPPRHGGQLADRVRRGVSMPEAAARTVSRPRARRRRAKRCSS